MIWPFTIFERHSVGTPADEEPAVLTSAIAGTTGLGVALTVPAVQAATCSIAETAACLDIAVVEIADDGIEVPVRSHQVAQLLAGQPNDRQPTFDLIRDLVATVGTHHIAANGQREVPRIDNVLSETETFRTEFLCMLARRDLSNVKQVIFDAHKGIKASALKALAAMWKRCCVHFTRDALLHAPISSTPGWTSSPPSWMKLAFSPTRSSPHRADSLEQLKRAI